MNKPPCALALFSGGLDSILACRVIASQGITVQAIKFVTPFFDYHLLKSKDHYKKKIMSKYGINVMVKDITDQYIELLNNPPHGFGKNFNPCLDCKILMVSEAIKMMDEFGASFIISGEVIGQRPMSQRKDTLRVIERDSHGNGILLRPLCAKKMPETKPEIEGIVDREMLLSFSGRGRSQQIELAAQYGITDYPNPAGGCVLTDPILSKRLKKYYQETEDKNPADICFLLVGRQFTLPHGGWLTLGRKEYENKQVVDLRLPGDILLKMDDWPGPTGLLRYSDHPEDIELAAALVARFGKKKQAADNGWQVTVTKDNKKTIVTTKPLADEIFTSWQR
jgi:hypothetical protein